MWVEKRLNDYDYIDTLIKESSKTTSDSNFNFCYGILEKYYTEENYLRILEISKYLLDIFKDRSHSSTIIKLLIKTHYFMHNYDKCIEVSKSFLEKDRDLQEQLDVSFYLGLSLYEVRVLEEAIETLTFAIANNKLDLEDTYRINFGLAMAYYRNSEFEKAIPFYEKAIEVSDKTDIENCTWPYYSNYWLGNNYEALNNYEMASKYFLEAFTHSFTDEFQYYSSFYLGDMYFNLKKYEEAITFLNISLKSMRYYDKFDVPPNNANIFCNYFRLGKSHYYLHEYDKALEYFREMKKYGEYIGDKHEYFYWLGVTYIALEEYELAIIHLEKAIEFAIKQYDDNYKDTTDEYYSNLKLGKLLYDLDRHEEAIGYLSQASKISSTQDEIYNSNYYLGLAYYYNNENKKAIHNFEISLVNSTDNSDKHNCYYQLGLCYYVEKNYMQAIDYLNLALLCTESQTDFYYDYYELGRNYLKLKNYQSALKNFLSSLSYIETDTNLCYTHLNLGITYYEMQDFNRALEHLKLAETYYDILDSSDLLSLYITLAKIYNIEYEKNIARDYLNKALEIEVDNQEILSLKNIIG